MEKTVRQATWASRMFGAERLHDMYSVAQVANGKSRKKRKENQECLSETRL